MSLKSRLISIVGYFIAVVIIFAALISSLGEILTPYFNRHLANFTKIASEELHTPITVKSMALTWRWYGPEAIFNNVIFLQEKTLKPAIEIQQLKINPSLIRSLLLRKLLVDRLQIKGAQLIIHQETEQKINLSQLTTVDVTDHFTGESIGANAVVDWLLSIPNLYLEDIHLQIASLEKKIYHLVVNRLRLTNSGNNHTLSGRIVLQQEFPTIMMFRVDVQGNPLDYKNSRFHFYSYLQGLNITQWMNHLNWHNVQLLQGNGSVRLSGDYNNDRLESLKTSLQIYNIELQSISKKIISIPRLSGNFNWQRDANSQTISGDQVFIDWPHHLWPPTHFTLNWKINSAGEIIPQLIQASYIDIADVKDFLLNLNLIPAQNVTPLTTLNPQGEIKNLVLENNASQFTIDSISLDALSLKTELNNIQTRAFGKLPAISNLSGQLTWDKNKGYMTINSPEMRLNFSGIFDNALSFDQFKGKINFNKTDTGLWTFSTDNLELTNEDIVADSKLILKVPVSDPINIDLTGNYQIMRVVNISHYLPLKVFEKPLATWLQEAFLAGNVTDGKVELRGNLIDFPFGDQQHEDQGKFLITGHANNVLFKFAPNWPRLEHVNGVITFLNRGMSVDTSNAKLLDISLENIHAVIPDLTGQNPVILKINTVLNSDLAKGLNFLHESPLEKTIGKSLHVMNLKGPMSLQLGLIIPLNNPDKTQVQGDVTMNKAQLDLPDWKLKLTKLQGRFQFDENSITAQQLSGEVFNFPIQLSLKTEIINKNSMIQADIQSAIDVPTLRKWLALPASDIFSGKTNYTAQLKIFNDNRKPTELDLQTDLKGILVKLPNPYGKTAEETKSLAMKLFADTNQLRTILQYGQVATAALTFSPSVQGVEKTMQFQSGEVNLGGTANWQQEPGLLISGHFKEITWDMIQPYLAQQAAATNISFLREIEMHIDTLQLFSQTFHQANITLAKSGLNWSVNLQTQEVSGTILVPEHLNNQTVQAKFQRIHIPNQTGASSFAVDPKRLPSLSIISEDVRIGDKNLGRVILKTNPTSQGLTISQLEVDSPNVALSAVGDWLYQNKKSKTTIRGTINTTQINNLLKDWNISTTNLVGNNANATFDLNWPDSPFNPVTQNMSGQIAFTVGKGRIVNLSESQNAKMDIGRFLNIFNISTIPRRLSGDFSDIFQKGYSFDSIKGDFTFQNGNAFTNNTELSGPVAGVTITGRIGLRAQDFDLKMAVTPYVTSGLPFVAAAVVTGGTSLIAGAATWMADKLIVGKEVSKVITHRYTITGSWNNPQWQEEKH